jgi:hypothetical protein
MKMENPATWGPLEHAIDDAIKKAEEDRAQGVVGLSEVRRIADAVRVVMGGVTKAAQFTATEARRIQ